MLSGWHSGGDKRGFVPIEAIDGDDLVRTTAGFAPLRSSGETSVRPSNL